MLDALATGDPDPSVRRQGMEEGIENRGLADAGLAGDQRYLSLSRPCTLGQRVQPIELGLAPRRGPWLVRAAMDGGPIGGGESGGDRGDEPVAQAVRGLDESRGLRAVSQGAPHTADADLQHRLVHTGVRPHRPQHRRLGHQLAGMLDQLVEHREVLGREGQALRPSPERGIRRVEAKRAEAEHRGGRHAETDTKISRHCYRSTSYLSHDRAGPAATTGRRARGSGSSHGRLIEEA